MVSFGCGGNRDKNKRQKMGQVAKFYADQIIITSDNQEMRMNWIFVMKL